MINQVVEYEVEPKVCSSCHKLGHEAGKCPPKRNRGLSRGRSQSRLGKNDGSARLTAVKQPITAVNTGQQATGKGKGEMEKSVTVVEKTPIITNSWAEKS